MISIGREVPGAEAEGLVVPSLDVHDNMGFNDDQNAHALNSSVLPPYL